jgi:hypothetical protein
MENVGSQFHSLQAGCLTKTPERKLTKGQPIYFTRMQITDGGREALASQP